MSPLVLLCFLSPVVGLVVGVWAAFDLYQFRNDIHNINIYRRTKSHGR